MTQAPSRSRRGRRSPLAPASLLGLAAIAAVVAAPSRALADVSGCIGASEQALSLKRAGKLRDARKQLAACAVATCPEELRNECGKRMDALNTSMPSLVIGAKDGAGNDLLAATVTVDGVDVATSLDGRPIEVDPGAHVVRVTAAGQPPAERKVVVSEGEKTRRESFVVGPVLAPRPAVPDAPAPAAPSGLGGRRTAALVVGGVGVVGVGLGATFGLLASSSWSSAENAVNAQASCASAASCPAHATAVSNHDTASTYATVSTVAFAAGGALVVAGLVTWLTAPARATERKAFTATVVPSPTPGGATLAVVGQF